MFEDLIPKRIKKDDSPHWYVCEKTSTCDNELCLHKIEHDCNELGRSDDDENSPVSDCSQVKCWYGDCLCREI